MSDSEYTQEAVISLEAIRERAADVRERTDGVDDYRKFWTEAEADRAFLLGLLDEAVELLTGFIDLEGYDPSEDEARAFLVRLGRDQ